MPYDKRIKGKYHYLVWDNDEPGGHYVNGHVTPEEFRAAVAEYFGDRPHRGKPTIPDDAVIEHVYVRSVRVENDDYGNRQHQWRHTVKGRGFPMTYWEVMPNLNSAGV